MAFAPSQASARSIRYVTGMPLTSAVIVAPPSVGLAPQVQDMVSCTESSAAISFTVAVKAFATSPDTASRHCRGLSWARSATEPQRCATALLNICEMRSLEVMVL